MNSFSCSCNFLTCFIISATQMISIPGSAGFDQVPPPVLTPRAVSERWICRCNFDILRREIWPPDVHFSGLGGIFWRGGVGWGVLVRKLPSRKDPRKVNNYGHL